MTRVRFAPSPTGKMHPGNTRIAVFNWLYARKYNGKFVLRIEDTDMERSSAEFTDSILYDMKWMGIDWDEGPYRQSERIETYQNLAKQLFESGRAYRCFCTEDDLEIERTMQLKSGRPPRYSGKCKKLSQAEVDKKVADGVPNVLRFNVDTIEDEKIIFEDLIKGKIEHVTKDIADFVITRNNFTPTYNFAVVIDDHDMKISHIFRGEDHIANTPKQIMLYKAFGYEIPLFGHLPILLSKNRTKLSKRDGGQSIQEYREQGFLPEAIFNQLAVLGGGFKNEDELLGRSEFIERFDIKNVAVSACVFDIEKLNWFNSKFIQMMDNERLFKMFESELKDMAEYNVYSHDKVISILNLLKDGVRSLADVRNYFPIFFSSAVNNEAIAEMTDEQKGILNMLKEAVSSSDFTSKWEHLKHDCAAKKMIKQLRIFVSGMRNGPPLDEIVKLVDASVLKKRLGLV